MVGEVRHRLELYRVGCRIEEPREVPSEWPDCTVQMSNPHCFRKAAADTVTRFQRKAFD